MSDHAGGADPLTERIPRMVKYNGGAGGVMDETHIRLHFCSTIGGYAPGDVSSAIQECVDRGVIEKTEDGYRPADV